MDASSQIPFLTPYCSSIFPWESLETAEERHPNKLYQEKPWKKTFLAHQEQMQHCYGNHSNKFTGKKPHQGYLYAYSHRYGKPYEIKIGRTSRDISIRLREWQKEDGEQIIAKIVIPSSNPVQLQKLAHEYFKYYHIAKSSWSFTKERFIKRREWFRVEGINKKYIEQALEELQESVRNKLSNPFKRVYLTMSRRYPSVMIKISEEYKSGFFEQGHGEMDTTYQREYNFQSYRPQQSSMDKFYQNYKMRDQTMRTILTPLSKGRPNIERPSYLFQTSTPKPPSTLTEVLKKLQRNQQSVSKVKQIIKKPPSPFITSTPKPTITIDSFLRQRSQNKDQLKRLQSYSVTNRATNSD